MYLLRPKQYIIALLLLFPGTCLHGQVRVGMYNSIKGLGLSAEVVSKNNPAESDIFTIYADSYGVFAGRSSFVGVVASYSHDYSFVHRDYEFFSLELHSGAGFMAGYARDYETGLFSRHRQELRKRPGLCVGILGNIGARFFFDRPISLDISFSIEPGMHIRTDEDNGNLMISTYNNGIFRFIYPQMRFYYNF